MERSCAYLFCVGLIGRRLAAGKMVVVLVGSNSAVGRIGSMVDDLETCQIVEGNRRTWGSLERIVAFRIQGSLAFELIVEEPRIMAYP